MGSVYGFKSEEQVKRIASVVREVEAGRRTQRGIDQNRGFGEGVAFVRVTGVPNDYGECDAEPVRWDAPTQDYVVLSDQPVKFRASSGFPMIGVVYFAIIQGECHDLSNVLYCGAGSGPVFAKITNLSPMTAERWVAVGGAGGWEVSGGGETYDVQTPLIDGIAMSTRVGAFGVVWVDNGKLVFMPNQGASLTDSETVQGMMVNARQWFHGMKTFTTGNLVPDGTGGVLNGVRILGGGLLLDTDGEAAFTYVYSDGGYDIGRDGTNIGQSGSFTTPLFMGGICVGEAPP